MVAPPLNPSGGPKSARPQTPPRENGRGEGAVREIASGDTARGAGLRLRRSGLPRHGTAGQWARAAESLNADGGATRV